MYTDYQSEVLHYSEILDKAGWSILSPDRQCPKKSLHKRSHGQPGNHPRDPNEAPVTRAKPV